MTLTEVQMKYGVISNGVWPNEKDHMVLLAIEPTLSANWMNPATGKWTNHIYCNHDMVEPLMNALYKLQDRGLLWELRTFDGCFNIRDRRAEPGQPSAHSWGMAIDLNAATNEIGTEGDISLEFATCWIESGFTWGKSFNRPDPMHFSLVGF